MSLLFLLSVALGRPYLGLLLFVLSAYFDAVDGAVARIRGLPTPGGAFLDSFVDRLSDVVYASALLLLGLSEWWILALATGSLLVSYARARAEGVVGARLEGIGIMERAERLLAILLVYLFHVFGWTTLSTILLEITVVLVWLTVAHRFIAYFSLISRTAGRAPPRRWPPPPGPP